MNVVAVGCGLMSDVTVKMGWEMLWNGYDTCLCLFVCFLRLLYNLF